jgi:hypothetical protein
MPQRDHWLQRFDEAVARFAAGLPAEPDPALPDGIRNAIAALELPANLPFARELWTAEAASLLAAVTIPILVVIGQKDVQVDWQADGQALARVVTPGSDVTFAFPAHANHVLQTETANPALPRALAASVYNAPDVRLDPETVEVMVRWLHARVPR